MKKKSLALLMCTLVIAGMIGCGKKEEPATEPEVVEEVTEVTDTVDGSLAEKYETATEVLDLVNGAFDDETRNFFGYFNEAGELIQGASCELSLDDADMVRSMVTFPADIIDLVDEAAVATHLMNTNTYTSAAFHLKNSDDDFNVASAIAETVMNNHWLCGCPRRLVIGQIENYIVYAYGNEELIQTFEQGIINVAGTASVYFTLDLTENDELPEELTAPETGLIFVDENGNTIEDPDSVTEDTTEGN